MLYPWTMTCQEHAGSLRLRYADNSVLPARGALKLSCMRSQWVPTEAPTCGVYDPQGSVIEDGYAVVRRRPTGSHPVLAATLESGVGVKSYTDMGLRNRTQKNRHVRLVIILCSSDRIIP